MGGDDIAQKSVSLGSGGDVLLHRLIMLAFGRFVTGILGCWCPITYNDKSVK